MIIINDGERMAEVCIKLRSRGCKDEKLFMAIVPPYQHLKLPSQWAKVRVGRGIGTLVISSDRVVEVYI